MIKISHPSKRIIGKIAVPGSKSETNRLLILKHLYSLPFTIENVAQSRDTEYLQQALNTKKAEEWYVGDAGTAMRFLTAYAACRPGREVRLSGTVRMYERPIGILVSALRQMGAQIEYLQKEGYPPLQIKGAQLHCPEAIEIDTSVSSQFITALMLIGGMVQGGLHLQFKGLSVSAPYVYLTARLMRQLGFTVRLMGNELTIAPYQKGQIPKSVTVEPDWSAASYWFLLALLAQKTEIYLPGFRQYSLQGDSYVAQLFEPLGVTAHFIGSGFRLKQSARKQDAFAINLLHNPDLAQTMAVAYAAQNVPARITGLQTLRIKETDRLVALQTELAKTGARVEIGKDFLEIKEGIKTTVGVRFNTYQDHRMAMALAPLGLLGAVHIDDLEVVAKSYRNFWEHLRQVGFEITG